MRAAFALAYLIATTGASFADSLPVIVIPGRPDVRRRGLLAVAGAEGRGPELVALRRRGARDDVLLQPLGALLTKPGREAGRLLLMLPGR